MCSAKGKAVLSHVSFEELSTLEFTELLLTMSTLWAQEKLELCGMILTERRMFSRLSTLHPQVFSNFDHESLLDLWIIFTSDT
jgi:hypothetical protein